MEERQNQDHLQDIDLSGPVVPGGCSGAVPPTEARVRRSRDSRQDVAAAVVSLVKLQWERTF
jgi:hypothetical protein